MDSTEIDAVEIVLFDGFDELDALGPYEVLENAAQDGADWSVDLVTLGESDTARGSHGATVVAQGSLSEDADLLIVPGGGWSDRAVNGAWAEVQAGDLPEAVRRIHENETTVASVCTGAMILEAAGLLEGRRATTHRSAVEDLRTAGADPVDARVVDDGDVLTAGGVTAGLDLAFWIVESAVGEDIANLVATEMEYDRSEDIVAT